MTTGNTTSATTEHLGGIEGNQACMLVSVADIRAHTPVRLQDRLDLQQQASQAKRGQPGLYPGMAVHKHARAHMCAKAQAVPSQPATAAILAGHVYRQQEGTCICNMQPSCRLTRHCNIYCSQHRGARQEPLLCFGVQSHACNARVQAIQGGNRHYAQPLCTSKTPKPDATHPDVQLPPRCALRDSCCFRLLHCWSRFCACPLLQRANRHSSLRPAQLQAHASTATCAGLQAAGRVC
jgi:hypothetical protein